MMKVWIVSIEWNQAPSEVTGDTGIVGVFADEDAARKCQREEQHRQDEDGAIVYGYSYGEGVYCIGCGAWNVDAAGVKHSCNAAEDAEAFCDRCGAELTEHKTCDNDHDDWTLDVHCTEHEVKATATDERRA